MQEYEDADGLEGSGVPCWGQRHESWSDQVGPFGEGPFVWVQLEKGDNRDFQ